MIPKIKKNDKMTLNVLIIFFVILVVSLFLYNILDDTKPNVLSELGYKSGLYINPDYQEIYSIAKNTDIATLKEKIYIYPEDGQYRLVYKEMPSKQFVVSSKVDDNMYNIIDKLYKEHFSQ